MFKIKSVTGINLLNEYIFMIGLNVAVFLLVTDTAAAGTAGFIFLLPLAVVLVVAAIYNTIRVTFFMVLAEPVEGGQGSGDGGKQLTRGWLRWMASRIEAVRESMKQAGAFRMGGVK